MSRTAAKFTQADISRALRAAAQCNLTVEVVLEPDGRIRIVPSKDLDARVEGVSMDAYDSIRL